VGGIIWVLGDVTTDLTLTVERFPKEGGDAFATYRRMDTGGFGANVGIVLARLGLQPRLIASVGDDEWGRLATASLIRHGVDVAAVCYDRTEPTHLTVIVVSRDGERTMLGHRGASAHVGCLPTLDSPRDRPVALVISGYALFENERMAQVGQALELADEAKLPVVLDVPTDLPPPVRTAVSKVMARIRILVIGGVEVCKLTGVADPEIAAESLSHPGLTVVVKLGSDGCLAARPDGVVRIPAVRVNPVDTTGAGDAFVAAFTALHSWVAWRTRHPGRARARKLFRSRRNAMARCRGGDARARSCARPHQQHRVSGGGRCGLANAGVAEPMVQGLDALREPYRQRVVYAAAALISRRPKRIRMPIRKVW